MNDIIKPKREMSDELKIKMKAGREASRIKRLEEKLKTRPLPINPDKINDAEKGQAQRSWLPARVTDIPMELKDPRYTYYFDYDNNKTIRKMLTEYWEIDTEIARKMDERYRTNSLFAGKTVDGAYRVNELILFRMPKELAKSRDNFYKNLNRTTPQTIKQGFVDNIKEEGGDLSGGVYTKHPSGNLPDMNSRTRI